MYGKHTPNSKNKNDVIEMQIPISSLMALSLCARWAHPESLYGMYNQLNGSELSANIRQTLPEAPILAPSSGKIPMCAHTHVTQKESCTLQQTSFPSLLL